MQTWVAHPVTATSNFQLSKSQRLPRYGNADEAAPQAGSRKSPADPREARKSQNPRAQAQASKPEPLSETRHFDKLSFRSRRKLPKRARRAPKPKGKSGLGVQGRCLSLELLPKVVPEPLGEVPPWAADVAPQSRSQAGAGRVRYMNLKHENPIPIPLSLTVQCSPGFCLTAWGCRSRICRCPCTFSAFNLPSVDQGRL